MDKTGCTSRLTEIKAANNEHYNSGYASKSFPGIDYLIYNCRVLGGAHIQQV